MPALALLSVVLSCTVSAQDPLEIIRKSVDRDQSDYEGLKNYAYHEHGSFSQTDGKGRVKKVERESREVLFLYGEPYERLIAKDGKPLPEKEQRKEQEKLDRFAADRKKDSPAERARRQRKYDEERRKAREFAREIPDAFDFRLVGEDTVGGFKTWVVDATPKPGYRPKAARAGVLRKLQGRLWIEQSGYRWVKAEAEAIDTLSFGLFLARLAKGTRLQFEQFRLDDSAWAPKSIQLKLDARLALLKRIQGDVDVRFDNFRRFGSESSFTPLPDAEAR